MGKSNLESKFKKWLPNLLVSLVMGVPVIYSLGSFSDEISRWSIYDPCRSLLKEDFLRLKDNFNYYLEDDGVIDESESLLLIYPLNPKGFSKELGISYSELKKIVIGYDGPLNYAKLESYVREKVKRVLD